MNKKRWRILIVVEDRASNSWRLSILFSAYPSKGKEKWTKDFTQFVQKDEEIHDEMKNHTPQIVLTQNSVAGSSRGLDGGQA